MVNVGLAGVVYNQRIMRWRSAHLTGAVTVSNESSFGALKDMRCGVKIQ